MSEKMDDTEWMLLSEFHQIVGDPIRIRLLWLLSEREAYVTEMAERLNITTSAVSHQLHVLRMNKLVRTRRCGKRIFYYIADDRIHTIIKAGREYISG